MNHLRSDPTRIHTNYSTQTKDFITFLKSVNSKPMKTHKKKEKHHQTFIHKQKLTGTSNRKQTS